VILETNLVAPVQPAVTLAEAKRHLRVLHDDDDDHITELSWVATRAVEEMTGRQLIEQTWRQDQQAVFGRDLVRLQRVPVLRLIGLVYKNPAENIVVMSPWDWQEIGADEKWFVQPTPGYSWPKTAPVINALQIAYVAGYGPEPEDVPAPLRHAVLMMIAHFYGRREAVTEGEGEESGALSVAATYKVRLHSSAQARALTGQDRMVDAETAQVFNIREIDAVSDRAHVWLVVQGGVAV